VGSTGFGIDVVGATEDVVGVVDVDDAGGWVVDDGAVVVVVVGAVVVVGGDVVVAGTVVAGVVVVVVAGTVVVVVVVVVVWHGCSVPLNVLSYCVGLPLFRLASITTVHACAEVCDQLNALVNDPPKSNTWLAPSMVTVTLLFGLEPSYWVRLTDNPEQESVTFGVCAEAVNDSPRLASTVAGMIRYLRFIGVRPLSGWMIGVWG
jgi:hypothetical protein